MEKYYKLGHLLILIKGADVVLPYLFDELKAIEISPTENPDIIFDFKKVNDNIENGIIASPLIVSEKEIIVKGSGFKYKIEEINQLFYVHINSDDIIGRAQSFPKLYRARNWNYLLPEEILAKNFMYDIFDYVTQLKNVNKNQSYMHASSFFKNGKAIAMVAWGGIGKTTSMLKLVTEDGWHFLSDDLGLIDSDGYIYRTPKKMQIYAYNVEGQPFLKKLLLKDRNWIDRANWWYKKKRNGIKGARRRVAADNLFNMEPSEQKVKLTDVFFLERVKSDRFMLEDISIDSLASRASNTVMSEINPFHKIETALHTVQDKSILPNYSKLLEQTKAILQAGFSNANVIKLIKIPQNADPDALANFLRTII